MKKLETTVFEVILLIALVAFAGFKVGYIMASPPIVYDNYMVTVCHGDTLIATKDNKSFTVSQAYYRKGFPGWELLNNKKVAIDYVEVINGFVYIFGSFIK